MGMEYREDGCDDNKRKKEKNKKRIKKNEEKRHNHRMIPVSNIDSLF
jgi:hypothetical protein